MKKRRAGRGFVSLGEVELAGRGISARRAGELALRRAWALAAGEHVSRKAQPLRVARGILEIEVADPRWEQVLRRLIPSLVARMAASDRTLGIRRFRILRPGAGARDRRSAAVALPPLEEDVAPREPKAGPVEPAQTGARPSISEVAASYLRRASSRLDR